jgi:tRNA-splicing endonuclease subunit Sen34
VKKTHVATVMADMTVSEPFPIFQVHDNYLIYDVDTVTYVRRKHHMCGVLIGNIPQAAQQNVYSGLPQVLMPEEARLLVETGHAYVVDDVSAHSNGLRDTKGQDRVDYVKKLEDEGLAISKAVQQEREASRKKALNRGPKTNAGSRSNTPTVSTRIENLSPRDDLLFDSPPQTTPTPSSQSPRPIEPLLITPTTSYPPLLAHRPESPLPLPAVPSAYPLFKLLHSQGYFLSPGLRFGCQYLAYPGDPLRFHSHFLATGIGWDDEIDLLDIVGGGRLGTGVKKGYMIGGEGDTDDQKPSGENVRAFSFEWAVM